MAAAVPPGLCGNCAHSRSVVTRTGAVFLRCGRSDAEPDYARYPVLPVLECPGFTARAETPPPTGQE